MLSRNVIGCYRRFNVIYECCETFISVYVIFQLVKTESDQR
jgi:hypothetical protein